jgi:hypothetical protein
VKAKFAEKPRPKAEAAVGRGEIAVLVGPYGRNRRRAGGEQYRHPNVFSSARCSPTPPVTAIKAEVVKESR